jgi:LysM repeat protein
MQQKPILWIFFLCISLTGLAQAKLEVKGKSPDLFVEHKVVAKETWFSVGRMYNLHPKEIAPFNGTDLNAGLKIGQLLKIPLVPDNFSQDEKKGADEVLVPVYHQVAEGEWMYRVSVNHNKVALEKLEKWNGITRDQIRSGMELVVGFLKVKRDQSALAQQATQNTAAKQPAPVSQPKAPVTPPREEKQVTVSTQPAKQVEKPAENPTPAPVFKQQESEVVTGSVDFNGGYFRAQYRNGSKSANGPATVFRSTSGWKDGKYYALMDNVAVGTIVKIRHTGTNKVVYAKVLGQLSDIKENAGLTIRISNAAAAELGAGSGDPRFAVEVNY